MFGFLLNLLRAIGLVKPLPQPSREIEELPVEEAPEKSLPSDYRVWIPGAENIFASENIKQRTRGEYKDGYPQGLIIHWDAGWAAGKKDYWNPFPKFQDKLYSDSEIMIATLSGIARKRAIQTAKLGEKNSHCYLVMDLLGEVYQSRPLNKWGYHAGKSFYKGLGYGVSQYLAGVEVKCPGRVEKCGTNKFKTWFGQKFDLEMVRPDENGVYYVMFTREQEDALVELCCKLWIHSPVVRKKKVFKLKYILGHDTVSPGRKSDPGASLSCSITEFQKRVREELISRGYNKEDLA